MDSQDRLSEIKIEEKRLLREKWLSILLGLEATITGGSGIAGLIFYNPQIPNHFIDQISFNTFLLAFAVGAGGLLVETQFTQEVINNIVVIRNERDNIEILDALEEMKGDDFTK